MTELREYACPRCGSLRQPGQEYCVDCGLRLPATTGALAGFRRTWVRRIGWYPGDWVWTALLALLVAAAGAALAIMATTEARSTSGTTYVATEPSVPLTSPAPAAAPVGATVDTSTLPAPPEPTTGANGRPAPAPNGRTPWPVGHTGWTVVLESMPATTSGRRTALARADRAAKEGLPDVGILVSARYSTLHPGYFVIFSGIYDARVDAESTLRAANSAGFSSAYVRQIAQ